MRHSPRRDANDWAAQLSRAGAWTLSARLALAGSGFVINIVLARLLAPAEFGLYLLAVSVVSVLILCGQLGLQVTVVSRVARTLAPGAQEDPIDLALKMTGLGFLGAACFGALYWFFGHTVAARALSAPSLSDHAAIMALWVAVAAPLGILAEAYRAVRQYLAAALFSGLSSALMVLLYLGAVMLADRGTDLPTLLDVCALASATSLLMALFLAFAGRGAPWSDLLNGFTGLLKGGVPLMLMGLATLVTTQADLWVAGSTLLKAEVAAYGVAARLVQLTLLPLLVLNAVLGPMFAQLHEERRLARAQGLAAATAALSAIPGLVVLSVLLVSAAPLLALLYGDTYAVAANCLVLLSAGQLVNTLCGPAAMVLMMCRRERTVMAISLFTATLTLGGGAALGRWLGMDGIALAAAAAAACHGLLCMAWVRATLGIWTFARFGELRGSLAEVARLARRTPRSEEAR